MEDPKTPQQGCSTTLVAALILLLMESLAGFSNVRLCGLLNRTMLKARRMKKNCGH